MRGKMKAIIWDGGDFPDSLRYGDFDIPEPGPGWVLVNNKVVGICGSDIHILIGDTKYLVPKKNFPAVLGHENAGAVVKTGEGVTSVKPGDRVAVEPIHGCIEFGGNCPMCRIGKYQLCQSGLTHVGMPLTRMLPGGYGEYSIVHESHLFHIPEGVTFEEAALLDILAVNVHAVNIGQPKLGDSVAVIGCGIVGLDMIQCLKAVGITNIIAVAKYEFQAEIAKLLGAKETIILNNGMDPIKEVMKITGGWGVDQVYECVGGNTDAVSQSISICCPGGKVIMLGGASKPRAIDLQGMLLKEINLLSSNSYSTFGTVREFQIAINMLQDGQVNHKCLVTHRFLHEDYLKAFETVMSKENTNVIKAVFVRE
ncbi:MAG TPA: alcohol dehydrogenase catalytic domain-containing protein [Clostridiaceae bacterium]|nr:alcohol dehydrogenase catalytic domain-containing protein [Clostridiaceae bacterium]